MTWYVPLLLTGLLTGQPPETGSAPASVRLARGQELVFRGTTHEESTVAGSVIRRNYDLESCVFIFESSKDGQEVAFQTVLRSPGLADNQPGSVRLELAHLTPNGLLRFESGDKTLPAVDGPPTFEPTGFVELPSTPLPIDYVRGVRCVRVERGVAASEGKVTETAWISTQSGVVRKLERNFIRFTGGERTASVKITTSYELVSELLIPDALAAGRRREIRQAWQTQQKLATLMPNAGKIGPQAFEKILASISGHMESQPATPFRPSVIWLQSRAEAGRRGETPASGNSP